MPKKELHDILNEYLDDRAHGRLSTIDLKKKLQLLGKDEEQMHEIVVEFEHEWMNEIQLREDHKKAKSNMLIGASVALVMAAVSILFALKIINFGRIGLIFYGAVAYGILLVINGGNQFKKEKQIRKRREIKWKGWI